MDIRNPRPGTPNRSGVSLLEVLISIFVIMVGLLGVAAVMPVGRFEMVEVAKSERSGACGRAGLDEVKIRDLLDKRMLDPRSWLLAADTLPSVIVNNNYIEYGQSWAIDPYFVARNSALDATPKVVVPVPVQKFPYSAPNNGLYMRRVTLAWVNAMDPAIHRAVFDRVFRWQDDLNIPVPKDADQRPRQVAFCNQVDNSGKLIGTGTWAVPRFRPGEVPAASTDRFDPVMPQCQGDFTWMVTVTPALPYEVDYQVTGPGTPPSVFNYSAFEKRRVYTVSVVVSYKRDFALPDLTTEPKPTERVVTATFPGGGWGGGDAQFTATSAAHLELRPDQWVMVCGTDQVLLRPVFRWYRVAAVGDLDTVALTRDVTLAGPDWSVNWCNNQASTPPSTPVAIVDGVVAVYTTTVELESAK